MEKTVSNLSKKGTRAYMAPELARQELCTENVDIYSLGLVMYRFLNHNRLPFLPQYPEKIKFSDRERAEFLRFSGAEVPLPQKGGAELGNIVVKACAYSPEKRYQKPYELRVALEEIYRHIPEESIECKVENIPSTSGDYIATGAEEQTINIFRTAVPSIKSYTGTSHEGLHSMICPMQEEIADIEDAAAIDIEEVCENKAQCEEEILCEIEEGVTEAETEAKEKEATHFTKETEKKGGKWKFIVVLLIFLLAGVGAFYGYSMNSDTGMPNFVGMNDERAIEILKERDISYKVNRNYNETFEKGKVYKQSPEKKTELQEDTKVILYVSKGKDTRVKMPSLINLKKSEATETLEKLSLKYTVKTKYSTEYKKGRVCKQSKKKDTKLKAGSKVTIWVSKGKKKTSSSAESSGSSKITYVNVPVLTMYTKAEAIAKLQNQGLNYSVAYVSEGYPEDIVTGQSIGSGRSVQKGTTVTIYVDNGE